jgi:hypothetical protein
LLVAAFAAKDPQKHRFLTTDWQRTDPDWLPQKQPLERNVPVFLPRVLVGFVFEHGQRPNQLGAREARLDDLVDPAFFGGRVGVGEALPELFDLLLPELLGVFARGS